MGSCTTALRCQGLAASNCATSSAEAAQSRGPAVLDDPDIYLTGCTAGG